jgi:hypothetical protein
VPINPTITENWKPEVLSEQLHVVHNIDCFERRMMSAMIFTASYEGIGLISHVGPLNWRTISLDSGNQINTKGSRGASEIKRITPAENKPIIATVEPWHGNQVVTYTPKGDPPTVDRPFNRLVLDDHLRWGHAVWFADLDGDKTDELVIGVRDNPDPKAGDTFTEKRGVRIYRNTDGKGVKWDRYILDDGGVAVEDLTVADLNGDGKPDIIAVGRQTFNCRIYWNQGK